MRSANRPPPHADQHWPAPETAPSKARSFLFRLVHTFRRKLLRNRPCNLPHLKNPVRTTNFASMPILENCLSLTYFVFRLQSSREDMSMFKKISILVCLAAASPLLSQGKVDKRLNDSTAVLKTIVSKQEIAKGTLDKARCIL